MMPGKPLSASLLTVIAVLLLSLSFARSAWADGQTRSEDLSGTHWAFSAFFGTGWYEVSNSESVFILRAPMSHTWRQSSWAEGQRELGIEFNYPVTLGLHNLDSFDDFTDTDNFGSVAFTPGVEMEIPVTEKWYLRPEVNFGWGTETHGGESAWIYYGGIKSRFTPGYGKLAWSILNALYRAGYNDESGDRSSMTMAMAGLEFHHPLQARLGSGEALQMNWHLTYSWLFDEAEFSVRSGGFAQSVNDQWELGIALAPSKRPFKIWFLSFEQVGLAFRASSDGEYRAITINASSPFH